MDSSPMKRVAVIGTGGDILLSRHGLVDAMNEVGMNLGNLIFQFAVWDKVKNPKIKVNFDDNPWLIRNNADVLVFPAANQINPEWDMEFMADFIEAAGLPVVCVGLGAQAGIEGSPNLSLHPGTERLVRVLSEYCHEIGVRGEFTAEVLNNLGIANIRIVGCPSNFINDTITGESIAIRLESASHNVLSSCLVLGTMEQWTRATEKKLHKLARRENSTYLAQTNSFVLDLIRNNTRTKEALEYFSWENRVVSADLTLDTYLNLLHDKGQMYCSAAAWIDSAGLHDLVYGMRMHGVIAAIQGGGLGISFPFDSRTLELVQAMGYPYVPYMEVLDTQIDSLSSLAARAIFSPDEFDQKRMFLKTNYTELMLAECVVTSNTI